MKNFLVLLTITLLTSCASKSDLKKQSDKYEMEISKLKMELKDDMKNELRTLVFDELKKEMKEEVYASINESLKSDQLFISQLLEKMAVGFNDFKVETMKAIVEEMLKSEAKTKEEIVALMSTEEFLKIIEDRVVAKTHNLNMKSYQDNKESLVNLCVKETLNQLEGQFVGLRPDGKKK